MRSYLQVRLSDIYISIWHNLVRHFWLVVSIYLGQGKLKTCKQAKNLPQNDPMVPIMEVAGLQPL